MYASVRRALRQAWELDDAAKAERLLRNLARRLEQEAPGLAASILEGLDEMLTVNWPAPGSEDTELGVLMEREVGHGEAEVYTRVQA